MFFNEDKETMRKIRELIYKEMKKKANKEWFIERFKILEGDYDILNNLKPFLNIELGVKPNTREEEAILIKKALLNRSITDYIGEYIDEGDKFYYVDLDFWKSWK